MSTYGKKHEFINFKTGGFVYPLIKEESSISKKNK